MCYLCDLNFFIFCCLIIHFYCCISTPSCYTFIVTVLYVCMCIFCQQQLGCLLDILIKIEGRKLLFLSALLCYSLFQHATRLQFGIINLREEESQSFTIYCSFTLVLYCFNPLNAELNPICGLLALLGAHHFLHVSRIRVKSLTLRLLISYTYIWNTHS